MLRSVYVVVSLAATLFATHSYASYPELTIQNNYCMAEVRQGAYIVPTQSMPLVHNGPLRKGEVFAGREGESICVRGQQSNCSGPPSGNYYCVRGAGNSDAGKPERGSY